MDILPVCVSGHHKCARCLQKPEKGVRPLGTRVASVGVRDWAQVLRRAGQGLGSWATSPVPFHKYVTEEVKQIINNLMSTLIIKTSEECKLNLMRYYLTPDKVWLQKTESKRRSFANVSKGGPIRTLAALVGRQSQSTKLDRSLLKI